MQQLEALIFDLEGTLVDSALEIESNLNTLLEEEGRPHLTPEQAQSCIVEGVMDSCRNAFQATGGLKENDLYPYVKRLVEHIRAAKPTEKQIYPYVRETLDFYHKKGLKLGICTNKNEEATLKQLEALDLIKYFEFVAGGNTFMVHKPNPDHVTGVLDKLSVQAKSSLFIGDSHGDLLASHGAGVPCVMITHGPLDHNLDKHAATQITEFNELQACIEKLGYRV